MSTTSYDFSGLSREMNRVARELEEIRSLLSSINNNTSSLLHASLQIEKAKAEGEIESLRKLFNYTQKTLEETIERYKKLYTKVLFDFVNDIMNGLEHFIKLADEELKPLWKIKNYMNLIFERIEQINPIEEDQELLETAINMYNERRNVANRYLYNLEEIFDKISEVRLTKEQFIDKVRSTVLNRLTISKNTLLVLKFYTVKVVKKDGTFDYYLIPIARYNDTKDLLEPFIQPLKISKKLYDFMLKSIQKTPITFRPVDSTKVVKALQTLREKARTEEEANLLMETVR